MTLPALPMLTALLCADPPALDDDCSRLLQAKDTAVRLALEQLAADLPTRLASEAERELASLLLVAFFARLYREGSTTVSRLPATSNDIWLDWWYRGQHAPGEGPRFRNFTRGVKTPAGEVTVRFIVASAQVASGQRGLLLPLPEQVQFDAERLTATIPFVYRAPSADERTRWGGGHAAQQRAALRALLAPCAEALAEAALPLQELLKHARAFVALQWTDRFLPVGLGPLLEARLEGYLRECIELPADRPPADAPPLDAWRRVYQGVREGAGPLIEALARAAEPERRLFEKRPFILRTEWLAPVMHVARSLWPAILANPAQLSAWRTLFDLSGPLDEAVLERHPTLVVDTRHFDEAFKQALLASYPDRDAALDGILIRAENYRALRFLEPGYQGRVRAVVIDPPYGTGNRDYPYRDTFEHCSWLTMMEERLRLAWQLLDEDGALFVHIDDHQMAHLGGMLDELCGEEKRVAIVVWHRTYGSHSDAKHFAVVHEYILVYARNPDRFYASENGSASPDGRELLTHCMWDYPEVGHTAMGTKELRAMLRYAQGEDVFPTVKPTPLIRRMLRLATPPGDRSAVLDFFAGSGSLAHAVIDQNRADGGNRRFLLVEQSRHFELTILPRVMRAMYCSAWKDGRPVDYPEPGLWWPEWVNRSPRLVQVVDLEGYEDSLESLAVGESATTTETGTPVHALRYWIPLSLIGQVSLLEEEQFAHPFSSVLTRLSERGVCSAHVDLPETFNALLGLHVESTCSQVNPDTGRRYQAVEGRLGEQRVLVLWSERPGGTLDEERPFLLARIAAFDLVLTNDPDGPQGMEPLAPLFRERMEGQGGAGPA
jgi:hypothetical protein